jgi:tRNA pseudouridine55 synthase
VLGGAKVGHAGTLDPDATGVLVVCLGPATKISAFLMEGEKVYVGRGRLGISTDTQDASGKVLRELPVSVAEEDVRRAAERFVGKIEQVPPMFSAVKIDGHKLYRLARQGVEVERAPRPVTVHAFAIESVSLPDFAFSLRCSKGTYVRTLVHDLGEALGCGAHLVELARAAQGGFRREDALPWAVLDEEGAAETIRRASIRPEESLAFLPACALGVSVGALRAGMLLPRDACDSRLREGLVRLARSDGRLAGIARASDDGFRVLHLFGGGAGFGRPRREP